jgi:hypothetical protein
MEGGTYFFTLALADWRRILLVAGGCYPTDWGV